MRADRRPRIGITTKQGGPATPAGRAYAAAVEAAGAEVVWLEPEALGGTDPEEILREVDGLVFSGGVDVDPRHFGEDVVPQAGVEIDARRDEAELPLLRAALERDVPVLGICRGVQMMNVAAGGTLHQDLGLAGLDRARHEQREAGRGPEETAHPVQVERASRLGRILGADRLEVNSFHHQAIKRSAPGFVVAARAPDGVIEALERPDRAFVVGVQWHPERMVGRHAEQRRLFQALVEAAKRRRRA
jgi:putative glutamine amidotransferase